MFACCAVSTDTSACQFTTTKTNIYCFVANYTETKAKHAAIFLLRILPWFASLHLDAIGGYLYANAFMTLIYCQLAQPTLAYFGGGPGHDS